MVMGHILGKSIDFLASLCYNRRIGCFKYPMVNYRFGFVSLEVVPLFTGGVKPMKFRRFSTARKWVVDFRKRSPECIGNDRYGPVANGAV